MPREDETDTNETDERERDIEFAAMAQKSTSDSEQKVSLEDIRPVEPDPGEVIFELGDDNVVLGGRFIIPRGLTRVPPQSQAMFEHDHLVSCEIHRPTRLVDDKQGLVEATKVGVDQFPINDVNDLFNIGDDSATATSPVIKRDENEVPVAADELAKEQVVYLYRILG